MIDSTPPINKKKWKNTPLCLWEEPQELQNEILKKRRINKTTDFDDNKKKPPTRIVNDKNVLWTCFKACKIEYSECVYCVCSVCHSKESNNSPRKKRSDGTKRRSNDDDKTLCDHKSLSPFTDSLFFSEDYRTKIKEEGLPLPLKCSICKYSLMDK